MTRQIKTVAVLTARPDKVEQLRELLESLIAPSRAESGNLRYDLWADPAEPRRFVLDELYVDHEAVAAHHATPHFQNYLARINDLGERASWTLDPIAIA